MLRLLFILFCFLILNRAEARQFLSKDGTDSVAYSSVLYVFQGSDWCAKCRQFEQKVLSDSAFRSALDSLLIRTEILDFPQRKKQQPDVVNYNAAMSEKFGFTGEFPTVVIFSLDNKKFISIPYKNEEAPDFTTILLTELKSLHE